MGTAASGKGVVLLRMPAEGPVVDSSPVTLDQLRELSARYLPADKVDGYVDFSWKNHDGHQVLRMRPERWLSSDLGQA